MTDQGNSTELGQQEEKCRSPLARDFEFFLLLLIRCGCVPRRLGLTSALKNSGISQERI